jgi:hypothetical protein
LSPVERVAGERQGPRFYVAPGGQQAGSGPVGRVDFVAVDLLLLAGIRCFPVAYKVFPVVGGLRSTGRSRADKAPGSGIASRAR